MRRVGDFSRHVKLALERRAWNMCSLCRRQTAGPAQKRTKAVQIGVAAHICGIGKRTARHNARQSTSARMSIHNGIWLCQSCAKLIDDDDARFTVRLLRQIKIVHETYVELMFVGRLVPLSEEAQAAALMIHQQQALADERHRARRRAERKKARHRRWVTTVRDALRTGKGNVWQVSRDDEEHADWADQEGVLETVYFGPDRYVRIPIRHRPRRF